MSEFRKYRLVSKLLDEYGVAAAPQKYVSILAAGHHGHKQQDVMIDLQSLAAQASNPQRFQELVLQLESKCPEELRQVLEFAQDLLKAGKAASPEALPLTNIVPVTVSTLVKPEPRPVVLEVTELNPKVPSTKQPSAIAISDNQVDDGLDQIASKLNKTQHRLGMFDMRSLKEPNNTVHEDQQSNSQYVALRTFKNDFEMCANRFPLPLQEIFIMEDLLNLLLGLPGRFVYQAEGVFFVDETLPSTIIEAVLPILQVSKYFCEIDAFIRTRCTFSDGRTRQALCASLTILLSELKQVTVLLEKKFAANSIGLQQFAFHLGPFRRNLAILSEIVAIVEKNRLRGGSILVCVEKYVAKYSGDRIVRGLLEDLLSKCAVPILEMTSEWLRDGTMEESACTEFFIRARNDSDPMDSSTSPLFGKYVIEESNMPSIFSLSVNKILRIGAYHNILRTHEKAESDAFYGGAEGDLMLKVFDQRRIQIQVEKLFVAVNKKMLEELMSGDRLMRALLLCKSYYFVEHGDLLHSFLDCSRKELEKPSLTMIWENVQNNWDHMIRTHPSLGDDANVIECYRTDLGLTEQLQRIIAADANSNSTYSASTKDPTRGVDVFSLRIRLEFPLTLILDGDTLAKYELLFRFLLRISYLQTSLCSMPTGAAKQCSMLKRQILLYLENVHQYIINEVLEPQWDAFVKAIPNATGMDAIIQLHTSFIDACLRQSMLTNAKLVQISSHIFTICTHLIEAGTNEAELNAKVPSLLASFGKAMRMFLEALQYYSSRDYDYHLGTLFSRLDYNNYYYANSYGQVE